MSDRLELLAVRISKKLHGEIKRRAEQLLVEQPGIASVSRAKAILVRGILEEEFSQLRGKAVR